MRFIACYSGRIYGRLVISCAHTLFCFYKNNFIRTASLVFAQNQEQLRTTSLKFENEKKKKGVGKSYETEGKEGIMKEFSLEEYSLFSKKRMLLWLY